MKWGCAQIYCDGDRNTFIVDKDGSLLGEGKKEPWFHLMN